MPCAGIRNNQSTRTRAVQSICRSRHNLNCRMAVAGASRSQGCGHRHGGLQRIVDQRLELGCEVGQQEVQHDQPHAQRNGKADRKDIELGGGAREDAQCKVGHQQDGDQRQGQLQPHGKHGRSVAGELEKPCRGDRLGADRQGLEAVDQHAEQQQVAIDRQKHQHRQQVEKACKHQGLPGALRVEKRCEAQTDLQADNFAGGFHRGKRHAHDKADGDADEKLLHQDEQALPRTQPDIGQRRQGGGNDQGEENAEADFDRGGDGAVAKHRRHHDQAENAGERPDETDQPGVELGIGDADHAEAASRR